MAQIDIRVDDGEQVDSIRFSDDQFHSFNASLIQKEEDGIKIFTADDDYVTIDHYDIDAFIKALEKAKQLCWF